jgi:hypothetical protein
MKVEYKLPKRSQIGYNARNAELVVIYDNNPHLIEKTDRYGELTKEEASKYVDLLNKGWNLTPKEYDYHVDIISLIYKEMITEKNLLKAIKDFPKDNRGYFKRRGFISVAKSRNVILNEGSTGYIGMELRFKFINYKTIELEYGKAHFIV